MDLKRYTDLKSKVDELQKRASRATGAVDTIKGQLKKDHGCNSVQEGKTLLVKLEKELTKTEKELEEAMDEFDTQFGDKLT